MKTVDRILGEAMTPYQKRIYKDPHNAFLFAEYVGERFPEAEPYIAKDPYLAYEYARSIIKGLWPEAEPTIAKSPKWAYHYALDVIRGRWPEAEATIAKDPTWAFGYAKNVIKGRWPEAEATIAKFAKSIWKDDYLEAFPDAKDDWILKGWLDWLDS